MLRSLSAALLVAAAGALAAAAPAAADEAGLLKLRDKYTFLTPEQLLTAGQRVCQATRSGMVVPDIVKMVQRDVDAGPAPAIDIVSAAVIELDC